MQCSFRHTADAGQVGDRNRLSQLARMCLIAIFTSLGTVVTPAIGSAYSAGPSGGIFGNPVVTRHRGRGTSRQPSERPVAYDRPRRTRS